MSADKGRSFEEVVEDVKPLIFGTARIQREWIETMSIQNPQGPLSEEVFIAMYAISLTLSRQLASCGATQEDIAQLIRLASGLADCLRCDTMPRPELV